MRMPRLHRRSIALVLGLSLSTTAGCAFLATQAPDTIGGDPRPSGPASDRGPERSAAGTVSVYRKSPVLSWGQPDYLRPHSLTGSLFDRTMPGRGCQATPVGVLHVAGVPNGAPAEDIYRLGPVRIGLAGLAVPLRSVTSLDREVVSARAMRSGALLAQRGPQCRQMLFLYMTIGGRGDRDAVLVSW